MKTKIKNDYWEAYKDLYKQAQQTGMYKMFLFDVVGSKNIHKANPSSYYMNLIRFTNSVTYDLLKLEKALGKKILHRHIEDSKNYNREVDKDKVVLCKAQLIDRPKEMYRTDSLNPLYWLGDMIYFIIERDSIPDNTFYDIFKKNQKTIIPNYEFHHKSGYYETDVWAESSDKFSRIYCIPVLEYLAKNETKTKAKPSVSKKEIEEPTL